MKNHSIKSVIEPFPSDGYMRRFDLLTLSYSCMGLFTLMGSSFLLTGRAVWLAYLAAIILGFLYILPTVFISSALCCGSGMYSLVVSLLSPSAASLYCISNMLDITMSLVALSFGSYIQSLFPAISYRIAGAVFLTVIFIINQCGLRNVSKSQNIMFTLLAIMLTVFIFCGLCKVNIGNAFAFRESGFIIGGNTGFISSIVILYYSSTSYISAISYGKYSQKAYRDIPWAMLISPLLLIFTFCTCAIITGNIVPLGESSEPITYAAKAVLPGILYAFFIVCGPCMSMAAFINGTFAYYGVLLTGVCKDGWLPEFIGKINSRGAPAAINTWYYITGMLPLMLGFDISQTANFINFIWAIISIIPCIAVFNLPKKFPNSWKKSHMHVPDGVYYIFCVIRFIINTIIAVISSLSLGFPVVCISTIIFLLLLIYVEVRCRHSGTPLYTHLDAWPLDNSEIACSQVDE